MNEKVEKFRERLPGAVGKAAQIVADNPVPIGLLFCGGIVAGAAARNVVKPKTLVEVIALELLLQAAVPYAASWLFDSGVLKLRIRDENNELVPFEPGKLKAVP
jgi:hypothetical protein